MAYELCPQCGVEKHQLVACAKCGFTRFQRAPDTTQEIAATPAPTPQAPRTVRITTKRRSRLIPTPPG